MGSRMSAPGAACGVRPGRWVLPLQQNHLPAWIFGAWRRFFPRDRGVRPMLRPQRCCKFKFPGQGTPKFGNWWWLGFVSPPGNTGPLQPLWTAPMATPTTQEGRKREQREAFNCHLLYYFVNVNFTKRFTINDHIVGFYLNFFKWISLHMKTAMSTVPTRGGGGLNLFSFIFSYWYIVSAMATK